MKKKEYIITTEQVSKWHPDKYADQISDAIVTECLKKDPKSHVAAEALVKDNTIVLAGEITTTAKVDYEKIARAVAKKLHYKVDSVINLIAAQSPEINNAVVKEGDEKAQGAGDQGIMFGYAVNAPEHDYLPLGLWLANKVIEIIENDVDGNKKSILKGDAKCQVVDNRGNIDEVLISVCHKEDLTLEEVQSYIRKLIESNGLRDMIRDCDLIINPSGTWTIGGPTGDCGLTGRKIVCDSYGGYAPVGGGAFSGKDPSKVDRSGAYMARQIAIELVEEFGLSDCNIQLSYGIGLAEPRSVTAIGTRKTFFGRTKKVDLSDVVRKNYDLTPYGINKYLGLTEYDYSTMAGGNHMKWFPFINTEEPVEE